MLARPSVLIRTSHPVPCVAVTALSAALFAVAGKPPAVCLLGAAAVLAGQLTIGWSNDLIDARRDSAAGRRDKPLALEPELAHQVRIALGVAVVLAVLLSLALGWRAAALHGVTVAGGWAYNLGLKATPWSALAYFVAFAALPAIATSASPQAQMAPAWTMLAAGLVGVAAHFGNVLPDLQDDLAAGVLGLPQRLGARGSVLAAIAALLIAAGIIDVRVGFRNPALTAVGTAAVLALALVALGCAVRRPRGQGAFLATMAAAAVDVSILAVNHGLG
ncbi:MAG TPA: UbiA family prenyltransferase [Jatrophihabitans sp.]|uniref:UbiA family prenyltransferase n=1 Tax=Jatrophihabitans sp. TaxID=1932789 RepID=UPI002EEBA745